MRSDPVPTSRLIRLAAALDAFGEHVPVSSWRIGVSGTAIRVWSVHDQRFLVWWEAHLLSAARGYKPGSWGCMPDFGRKLGMLLKARGRRDAASAVIVSKSGISIRVGTERILVGHGPRAYGSVLSDPLGRGGVLHGWPSDDARGLVDASCLAAAVGFASAASTTGVLTVGTVRASVWQGAVALTDHAGVTCAVSVVGEGS